jgi:hypothetical protein
MSLRFTHGGSYTSAPGNRPIISVEIAAVDAQGRLQGQPVRTTVLVDSGADMTMLDGALARPLGIDLSRCPQGSVGGVGHGGVPVAAAPVKMALCDTWLDIPVNFTLRSIGHTQLLGRAGAFESILFTFVHQHRTIVAAAA